MHGRLHIALLGLASVASAQNAPYPPPGRMIDVEGRKIHLNCTGVGRPVVVIAGAGYSFDWALVQPEIARFTRVCTYDPAGSAWSDAGPPPSCANRAAELHQLLANAGISGPVIMAGLSIGALIERYYAAEYPAGLTGMIIVDHAFLNPGFNPPKQSSDGAGQSDAGAKDSMALSLEDSSDFMSLPARSRALHKWAAARQSARFGVAEAQQCEADLTHMPDAADALGEMPLVVISTANQTPGYSALQGQLLNLSHRSKQILASHSFHAIEIDQPDVVVQGIRAVVDQVRKSGRTGH